MRWGFNLAFGMLLLFGVYSANAQDLRQQFGTRSAAAAEALQEGIDLVQNQKPAQALAPLQRAIEADPDLQLSYYWVVLAHFDQGNLDEGIAVTEKLIEVAERTEVTNITIDACVNAGIALGQIKEEDKAARWFSKAILLDPNDLHKLHWKAYRNMAIGHHQRDRNLAAGLCALNGYLSNSQRVELDMVGNFLTRAREDEVAQILYFGDKAPRRVQRMQATKLGEAQDLAAIEGTVSQLLPDEEGNRVVVIVRGETRYYLIDCDQPDSIKALEAPGNIAAAAMSGGQLYLSIGNLGLVHVDLATGKSLQEWKLPNPPSSLAVMPTKGVALFPVNRMLTTLDLESGKTHATDFFADLVAADPEQRFCFAAKNADDRAAVGLVVVNGRPMMLRRSQNDWLQTSLLKFVIAEKKPVLAEVRMNAASNGRSLDVSPDGQWVSVVGGGGWRPNSDNAMGQGYGMAVFAVNDLSHTQGFFGTEAYPQAIAIHPVTGQVAAVRSDDTKVYDLTGRNSVANIKGPFGSAALWSPDGKWLYVAGKTGLRAVANTLSASEETTIAAWRSEFAQKLKVASADPKKAVTNRPESQPIAAYATFEIKNDKGATLEAINAAIASERKDRPIEWLEYAAYQKDDALRAQLSSLASPIDRDKAGIRLYQLKKLKAEHPTHPAIDFLLGVTYQTAGQIPTAEAALLAAVHSDQARTSLTFAALRQLAEVQKKSDKPQAAAYCMAHLIGLDRSSNVVDDAVAFFKAADLADEARPLLQRSMPPLVSGVAPVNYKWPALEVAVGKTKPKLTTEELFASVAPSVVLVRTTAGSGSGVCVGEAGLILTNAHVVTRDDGKVQVYCYTVENEKIERLEPLRAELLYRSAEEDIALLRVADPPKTLAPIKFERNPLRAGAKVFALGSPGLGDEVLDQSISEGIISSPARSLNSQTFVQHTAAVNPGNSGGPLLNEYGLLIGIVTRKAELENVSFAIPAQRIQTVYSQLRNP